MHLPSLTLSRRFALVLGLSTLFGLAAAGASDEFLPAAEAFKYEARASDSGLAVRYRVQPGYYLYRDRLAFESTTPGVTLGPPQFPAGEEHEDDYFGRQVIYREAVDIPVPVRFDGPPRDFELRLKLQGCADAGLCYPPLTWTTSVSAPDGLAAAGSATLADATAAPAPTRGAAAPTGAPTGATESTGGFNIKRLFGGGEAKDGAFLPVDEAFALSASSGSPDQVTLRWDVADGYYLYRDKVKVTLVEGPATIGTPLMPEGKLHADEYFGEQVVYYGELVANVPVAAAPGTRQLAFDVAYMGCADAGLCYPPTVRRVSVDLGSAPATVANAPAPSVAAPVVSEQDALARKIRDGNLLAVLATFFGAGLLLAFTPCVLPMVPILSGIIVGAGRDRPISRGRAFSLSLAYVLGMALTYTIAGAVFAAAGQQAQAFFQKPWIIALFAGLFVLLALAMFGVFNLQVPAALQSRLAEASNKQKQGTLLGTAVMGALSSLIVTACVAPPLVAALAVIGQSGDVLRGAAALFALSLGMGVPLLLVGASAGQLLPRAGAWMDTVKAVFGVMLLAVAIWMLDRILPGPLTLALWATLAFVSGYGLMTLRPDAPRTGGVVVRRGFGALAMVYGVLLLIGALAGRSDPLQPLAGLGRDATAPAADAHVEFIRVKTLADLEREVGAARAAGQPAMLDFYADWCVSCKEMERFTFTDPGVQAEFARARLLQADVTANDAEDQALLQHFGILGPPTIVFFDPTGSERPEYRVVGFKKADEFRIHLAAAFGEEGA
jgi:thiol:disulfide interchange protein DsbD